MFSIAHIRLETTISFCLKELLYRFLSAQAAGGSDVYRRLTSNTIFGTQFLEHDPQFFLEGAADRHIVQADDLV